MRWPLVSRRRYARDLAHQERGWQLVVRKVAAGNRDALAAVATELSTLKDQVALHIVACKHPSSALSDAHSAAIALQEACDAHGIDIRLELGRLEGSDL